jgi:hypothetical protein
MDFLPRFLDDVFAFFHAAHFQDGLYNGAAAENQKNKNYNNDGRCHL